VASSNEEAQGAAYASGQHPQVKSLLALYREAESRVRQVVDRVFGKKATKREQLTTVREVRGILNELDRVGQAQARNTVKDAFISGADLVNASVKATTIEKSGFSAVNRETVRILSDNLAHRLGDATTVVGRQAEDTLRRVVVRQALQQRLTELPQKAAIGMTVDKLKNQGVTGFTDKSGRKWSLESYAQMALRTVVSEAMNEGIANRMAAPRP
jgi:hypothetical protein